MDTGWATTGQLTPVTGRARWTVILLAATIAVDVIAIAFDIWEISLLGRVLDGRAVGQDDLSASDTRQGLAAFLGFGVLIATAVLFIRWFSAAYRNLLSLGVTNLRHSPGWAIGAWFAPVLNLWRPKEIANDIWRGSDPDAPAEQGRTSSGGRFQAC